MAGFPGSFIISNGSLSGGDSLVSARQSVTGEYMEIMIIIKLLFFRILWERGLHPFSRQTEGGESDTEEGAEFPSQDDSGSDNGNAKKDHRPDTEGGSQVMSVA